MRPVSFGRHLHSQIVLPLLVVLVLIGTIATVVAVSIIGRVINDWVDETARSTSAAVIAQLEERGIDAVRGAKLASENAVLEEASTARDVTAISGQLVLLNQSLKADNLMLLDEDGAVLASTGSLQVMPGDEPLEKKDRAYLALLMSHPILARIGSGYTASALEPVKGPEGLTYTLVLSEIIDDHYLAALAEDSDAALTIYDSSGRLVASAVPRTLDDALTLAISAKPDAIDEAMIQADAEEPEPHVLEADGEEYRTIAEKVTFGNDPTGSSVYLVTTVGTAVTGRARTTTTNLIVMWSVVAIGVLFGLGWWVARSISMPLATLSENAARVAEGDYSAKLDPVGANEVSQLAENFNRMTDSLQERSESLTKKVLELATLYEMSRSLGSTLDLETLLDSVLDSALRIFDVEIGYVTMLDRDTGKLEVRAWKGTDLSRADDATVRNSMSEWVVREGRPLIFNPQASADEGGEQGRGDSFSGALAALCVPLPSSEGTVGAITVGSRNAAQRFTSDDVRLLATIANHVTIAVGNIALFSSVQEAYLATVRALAAAVDAKDPYTRGHSDGVATYALRIGEALRFSPEQMIALEMAAYLHDIGKIGISEDILLKPGKLTDAEMSQMRHHPLIGANILKPVAFPWPIAPIVRHHHEHYDGAGYPAGLKTEEIPILARVLTVADSFEAMVADRPYRRGRSQQEAMLELRRCSGTQFDPRIVDAFIEVLESSDEDMSPRSEGDDEIGSDEAQAVYIAVADGMFSCFRRLGGPRLANNLERAVNDRLREESVQLSFQAGRLIQLEDSFGDDEVTTHLARALTIMGECIETASGAGLADHFLAEALEALPERMRSHAEQLGFTPPV
jgi:putative nucleotidyltransferase with HDIG domain